MTVQAVRPPTLSCGEREVLRLMAEGLSNQGIADRLVLSLRTVEGRVAGLYEKLCVGCEPASSRRVIAVLRYLAGE